MKRIEKDTYSGSREAGRLDNTSVTFTAQSNAVLARQGKPVLDGEGSVGSIESTSSVH